MSVHRLAPMSRLSRAAGWLCLLTLVVASTGCGGPHGRTTVKGKVTFNNEPVELGTISFLASDNSQGTAQLGKGGAYTMTDAPVGEVRVMVEIPKRPTPVPGGLKPPPNPSGGARPPGAPDMGAPPMPGDWKWIPDKYAKYETSDLKWTVPANGGDHDIPLTP